MGTQFTLISGSGEGGQERRTFMSEDKVQHLKNVTGEVLDDAQQVWAQLWRELQGVAVDGCLVLPNVDQALKPRCGWPEFLEAMWLLKHHLDYAQKFVKSI